MRVGVDVAVVVERAVIVTVERRVGVPSRVGVLVVEPDGVDVIVEVMGQSGLQGTADAGLLPGTSRTQLSSVACTTRRSDKVHKQTTSLV